MKELRWVGVLVLGLAAWGSAEAQPASPETEVVVEGEGSATLPPPPPVYPANFAMRPLTLPAMTLRADLGFQALHFEFGFPSDSDFTNSLGVGGAFGILDDLEVGLGGSSIAPTFLGVYASSGLRGLGGVLSPEGARGFIQPEIYGRYRFFSSDMVEVGAELGFSLPTDGADFGMTLGVPARLRFGESFALDLALVFLTSFGEDIDGDLDPFFVLSLNVAPRYAMDIFYVGVDTGFSMTLDDPELTFIPFGLEAGATLDLGPTVVVDVFAHGGLPLFLAPGSDGDKVISEVWMIGFGARFHVNVAGG